MHINWVVHLRGLQFGGFSGGLISSGVISGILSSHLQGGWRVVEAAAAHC